MSVSTVSTEARTFLLPDLGAGLTDAEVVAWHVAPGDDVRVDQIVVTVETAKATVELPCPFAGQVLTLHSAPGAVLEVGMPLLSVGAEQKSGSGNVLVGYGTSEVKRSGRRRAGHRAAPAAAGPAGSAAAAPSTQSPTRTTPAMAPKVISPVVRRLARDNHIDLEGLAPTGPGHVICRADVEAALRVGPAALTARELTAAPGPVRADRAGDIRIPLRGVR